MMKIAGLKIDSTSILVFSSLSCRLMILMESLGIFFYALHKLFWALLVLPQFMF
jgi:hypothetical protein